MFTQFISAVVRNNKTNLHANWNALYTNISEPDPGLGNNLEGGGKDVQVVGTWVNLSLIYADVW